MFRFRRPIGVAVHLPEGSDATIATAAGAVVCTGPLGAVRVETASAGVRVPSAASVDVVGVSGEVQVGSVAGDASLKTVSGAIEVGDVRGRLVLRTVSGRTRVRRAGSDVEARSVSGDVALQRLERGVVRLDSVSGDATLGVEPGVAVWLDLDSASGNVRSELRVQRRAAPTAGRCSRCVAAPSPATCASRPRRCDVVPLHPEDTLRLAEDRARALHDTGREELRLRSATAVRLRQLAAGSTRPPGRRPRGPASCTSASAAGRPARPFAVPVGCRFRGGASLPIREKCPNPSSAPAVTAASRSPRRSRSTRISD